MPISAGAPPTLSSGGRAALTPKSADTGRRAARSIEFACREYWQARPLAIGLVAHSADAVQFVENGGLDKWLRRA